MSPAGKVGFAWGRRSAVGIVLFVILLPGVLALFTSANYAGVEGGLDKEAAQHIVDLTNAIRRKRSLAPLSVDPRLTLAAERHAQAMAQQHRFDHVGPDGSTIDRRVEAAGYLDWASLGENLAMGTGPTIPVDIVSAWMDSARHRDNLLSPILREIGVGCYVRPNPGLRFWCVQDFGTRGR